MLQPLLARPHPGQHGQYQIIAGERRWRAAQAAGLHEVPVLIRPLTDTEAMAAALVENLQRQDLDPIEEAEGYKRLIGEFGLTQDGLGELVGKSRSHVANTMRLLQLPAPVLEGVRSGTLSAGHARALLTHPQPEQAARVVIARGLNVRQTEALVQRGAAAGGGEEATGPGGGGAGARAVGPARAAGADRSGRPRRQRADQLPDPGPARRDPGAAAEALSGAAGALPRQGEDEAADEQFVGRAGLLAGQLDPAGFHHRLRQAPGIPVAPAPG